MGIEEMGVDEVGVDEMGSRRSGTTPKKCSMDLGRTFPVSNFL